MIADRKDREEGKGQGATEKIEDRGNRRQKKSLGDDEKRGAVYAEIERELRRVY